MYLRNTSHDMPIVQNNIDGFLFGFFTVGSIWVLVFALIICNNSINGGSFMGTLDNYIDNLVDWFNKGDDIEHVYPIVTGRKWILKRRVIV
jgi:hypothetical protein